MNPAIIQAIISFASEMGARGKEQEAMALLQSGLDEFGKLDLPKLEAIAAEVIPSSELAKLKADPGMVQAQRESLGALDEIISGEGTSIEDKAAINAIGNDVSRRARVGRDALRDNMAARGALGSGMDYALQAKMAQDQNNTMAEAGLSAQSQALARRFRAIQEKGKMAGDMRSQDFGERRTAAGAADELARFNAASRDAAKRYNAQLPQQQYENMLRKLAGKTNQLNAVAGAQNAAAQQTREMGYRTGYAAGEFFDDDDKKKKKES